MRHIDRDQCKFEGLEVYFLSSESSLTFRIGILTSLCHLLNDCIEEGVQGKSFLVSSLIDK